MSELDTDTNPHAPGPDASAELNDAVSGFIAEIEKEYAATTVDDALAALPDAKPLPGAPEAVASPETPGAQPTDPKPATVTPVEAGLERLVAREVEIRTREDALNKRESDYRALEARAKELEARAIPEDFMVQLRHSPTEALKALGLDPENVVRTVIAEKMGEKAPENLRNAIRESKTQAQLRTLENKIMSQEREAAQRAFFDKTTRDAREYVLSGLSKDVPTVLEVAKTAPERVHQEIMQELIADAQSRAGREPNGDILPFAEAAKRVEARWDAFRKLLTPSASAAQTASTPQVGTPKTTVSGTQPPVTKTNTPAVKSPDRPLAPWLQVSNDAEEGIRAALMEYKRVESGNKP